ncbi:MATH domain and coiled-coil domain-containing protein At3g58270-like isoform X1 [Pyrus x bretschneideri]|uniref:MATH domain and coiled-coil domain-containing protein At3g58270-like isoform X1 n=1 Tax=Pyrus x bretschneideri TaxID=225117 RepID=UPI00202DCEF2|nr:MATH domain and coiled-coil domain-containing protein At3g58270-like isoform X1 [Pyrus x bretschneideri]XP_048442250.1 MATH domain and coiled-coil domain-containing protein At3g58270-like isoform X1 [Pyrus x bretschneideri]XP_048442251.1 MATH domain and coiled-coil domain-containing protein At3g58270-like isoform X1 [Pyrus x bretschneideri]XP_048442252.1 MATH domain and coiled-coil domain-containing protein At3g58270-like isoform X1 [Pyrus x bretschneideri]
MEKKQVGELVSVTFTWKIEKFSRLRSQKHYSDSFNVGDFEWQIVVYPKGSSGIPGTQDLSIYLKVADASALPSGWSRYAQFTLTVVNQVNYDKSITVETKHVFCASKMDWGFTSFMPLSELCDVAQGFIVNDTCVLEAEVAVSQVDYMAEVQETWFRPPIKPSHHEDERQGYSDVEAVQLTAPISEQVLAFQDATSSEQKQTNADFEQHEQKTSAPVGELMDFRGLGKIDKAFVPFLEEVCLLHPSLIECQRKRSPMFTEWAFTALGRLLHFLKTNKGTDMNEDACEHLQLLWEELESFRFDLAWLKPHVQSALGMKKFVERELEVKELRNNVDALEIEVKRLKARLNLAELDFEDAKRDMGEAEQSFVEINMDGELGYGGMH